MWYPYIVTISDMCELFKGRVAQLAYCGILIRVGSTVRALGDLNKGRVAQLAYCAILPL